MIKMSNFTTIKFEYQTIYISYQTIIAFEINDQLYITKNKWNVTTGKHLNLINPDHKIRLDYDVFRQKMNEFKINQIRIEFN